jgi:DNA recombination protein RmuC
MISLDIDQTIIDIGLPALAIGVVLGALAVWLFSRHRHKQLLQDLARSEASLKNQEALQQEREAAFELANAKLTQAFADISNRSLRANSDTFLRLAEQNLETQQEKAKRELSEREKAVEDLVKPIRDALEASNKQISELEKARSEAYGGIKSQLEEMQLNQKSLTAETQNLVKALRRPEVRGRWGEITLRRLVELAGMVEHCDFVEQAHTVTDGQIIRPRTTESSSSTSRRRSMRIWKRPKRATMRRERWGLKGTPKTFAPISVCCQRKPTGNNSRPAPKNNSRPAPNLSSCLFRVISS